MGSWQDRNHAPPEGFWHTLVADSGREGRNAPFYYPRAFKDAVPKNKGIDTLTTTRTMNDINGPVISNFLAKV